MKISLAMDHGGIALRQGIVDFCGSKNFELLDHGTVSAESVDYPDYAILVADDIRNRRADRGILICRTGLGMAMAANRFVGVRAAAVWDLESVTAARAHNDCNVLCLGARWTAPAAVAEILDCFFATDFEGGRHGRRLAKFGTLGEK